MNHQQITQGLREIGAAWAVRDDKYCSPNDPFEAQQRGEKTYHIHPDAAHPYQNDIRRFYSLAEIAAYIQACEEAGEAIKAGNDVEAEEIMQAFEQGLRP